MPNSSPNHLDIDDVFTLGAEQQSRRKSQVITKDNSFNYTNRAIMSFVDAVGKMNEEVLVPSRLRDIEVRENDANELMPVNSDLYSFYEMLNTVKKDLFSSTIYYKTFQPSNQPSTNNSGQNSGRVTPTHSLSRRSSYSIGIAGGANNSTLSTNGTNGTSNGYSRSNSTASPTNLLMPPTTFERKLSSPCPINGDGSSSPDLTLLLPSLSLSYVSRATSLSTLLASVPGGMMESNLDSNESATMEERVQQITGCFMYHLSALYTIMGHFTKAANYITKRYQEEMNNAN